MNDKKILIALTPQAEGSGLVNFVEKYVNGENLDVTIFVIRDAQSQTEGTDEMVDALYLLCATKMIPFRIREIDGSEAEIFADQTAFADLLVIERHALAYLNAGNHRIQSSCALVVLPEDFKFISNVLLITDGTAETIKSIKQFFQIFSRQLRDLDVTLLNVSSEKGGHMRSTDEVMLIGYIKQYCRNIGMLKVRKPLTSKLMRPVKVDEMTIVVSSPDFMQHEAATVGLSNPLQNLRSTLFFPNVK
jgi:hypothetical protein